MQTAHRDHPHDHEMKATATWANLLLEGASQLSSSAGGVGGGGRRMRMGS